MTHFLSLWDLEGDQLNYLLQEAIRLKTAHQHGERPPLLAGRVLGLVFEKPSLRTRASFEAAMAQMGGTSVFLSNPDGAMGVRESVPDFARTLSQYADAVVLRDLPVTSYNATAIKKTITGHGRATKQQMQHAMMRELRLPTLPEPPDVADALAAALCHYYSMKLVGDAAQRGTE